MFEQNGDDDVWSAQLREVALRAHDLDDGLAVEVPVEVLGDGDGHGQVLGALQDVAWDGDHPQVLPQIAHEDRLGHAQRDVRSDVEQRPAELLDRHRVQVVADGQGGEPRRPRLVVGFHGVEELVQVPLLESPEVIYVVQVPAQRPCSPV